MTNGGGRRRRVPRVPRPRGPLIEFAPLDAEVARMMQEAQQQVGNTAPLGPRIAGHKPKSRWAGADWASGGKEGNLWMHPMRLLGRFLGYPKVGSFSRAGGRTYRQDLQAIRKAEGLRATTDIHQSLEQERVAYENAVRTALNALRGGVASGTITEHNAGFHMQQYRSAVDAARTAFRGKIANLRDQYRKDAVKAGAIEGSPYKF